MTRNYSLGCGAFNGPVPYKVRRTLERHEPLARESFNPRKGTGVRRSPRGLLETKQAPQAPMPRRTLERHEPLARESFNPRKGTGVRRSPRGPLETKRAPQAPMPRRTLERHEPLARDNFNPRKGTGVRRSPRGPLETKRALQAPMPRCITDQRLGGWLAQAPRWSQMPGRKRLAAAPHHFY
jgi:hypothetical protein